VSPEYCWPFDGSRGEVLIRLPTHMRPTAITIQHVSQMASLLGTDSSAPRDFTVSVSLCRALGGLDEKYKGETLLGIFTYDMQKEPNQTFPLQNGVSRAFHLLKLHIWSNWGDRRYTCIYRVQVHGKAVGMNVIGQTH
ncbi:SPAG4 protein, partial [Ciccaba nigrolineata]|nr:SPAG4 protein [Ciccaba nigrolineata]